MSCRKCGCGNGCGCHKGHDHGGHDHGGHHDDGGCGCDDCRRKHHHHHKHDNCLGGDGTVSPTPVNLLNNNASLSLGQLGSGVLRIASTPNLTGARSIALPSGTYSLVVIGDASLGAFPVTLSTGVGASVNLSSGQTLFLNVTPGGVFLGG